MSKRTAAVASMLWMAVVAGVAAFLWARYGVFGPSRAARDETCSTPIDALIPARRKAWIDDVLLVLRDGSTLALAKVSSGDSPLAPSIRYLIRFSPEGEYDSDFGPSRRCMTGVLVGADAEGVYLLGDSSAPGEPSSFGLSFRPYKDGAPAGAPTSGLRSGERVLAASPRLGLSPEQDAQAFLAIWNPSQKTCDLANARLSRGRVEVLVRAELGRGRCDVRFRPAPPGYAAGEVFDFRRFSWDPSRDPKRTPAIEWDDANPDLALAFESGVAFAGVVLGAPTWLKPGSGDEGIAMLGPGRRRLTGPMAERLRTQKAAAIPIPSVQATDRLRLYDGSVWSIDKDGNVSRRSTKPPWDRF